MKTIKLNNGITVELYDSIKDIPMHRHHEFQKLAMQDAEIGSTMEQVAQHLSMLHKYLANDKKEEAMQEAVNLHNNLFFTLEGIHIKSLCFAAYIHKMNGKSYTNIDKESALKTLEKLSKEGGLTLGMVEDQIEELKKKFLANFNPNFLINTELPSMEIL